MSTFQYFGKLLQNDPEKSPLFVGPFDSSDQAKDQLQKAMVSSDIEYVDNFDEARNPKKAVKVTILPKIAAKKEGLAAPSLGSKRKNTLIGQDFPLHFDELKIKNGNSQVEIEEEEEVVVSKTSPSKIIEPVVKQETRQPSGKSVAHRNWDKERKENLVIWSNYPDNISWLEDHGFYGEKLFRLDPTTVDGKNLFGTVPPRIAVKAKRIIAFEMPNLRVSQAKKELTKRDLDEAGTFLRFFKTIELNDEWEEIFEYLEQPGALNDLVEFVRSQG